MIQWQPRVGPTANEASGHTGQSRHAMASRALLYRTHHPSVACVPVPTYTHTCSVPNTVESFVIRLLRPEDSGTCKPDPRPTTNTTSHTPSGDAQLDLRLAPPLPPEENIDCAGPECYLHAHTTLTRRRTWAGPYHSAHYSPSLLPVHCHLDYWTASSSGYIASLPCELNCNPHLRALLLSILTPHRLIIFCQQWHASPTLVILKQATTLFATCPRS